MTFEPTQISILFVLGCFFLVGYVAHFIGKRTHIPRVTLLLLLGLAAGPSFFDIVPEDIRLWFPEVSQAALSVIGFELGEKFLGKSLKDTGKTILTISLIKVFGSAIIVFVVLLLLGTPLLLAILLAGIAPATAPAATADIIKEAGAKGELSRTTLRLVAIDDAWGVILFSALLVVAGSMNGDVNSGELLWAGLWEVLGALLLGVMLGFPMAWLTGRVSEGELTLVETLGFVFLCGGLASSLHLSFILACMSMGCVVSNVAHHHSRPFHAIEGVREPFLIIFFLLAGFHIDLNGFYALGSIGGAYILARTFGVVLSGFLGARLAGVSRLVRNHLGWCLLPQAGIALGLALLAAERHPEIGGQVLLIVVGTTVVFEIVGPIVTLAALRHADEIPHESTNA